MKALLAGYAEARGEIALLKETAQRGARNLDFWLEAVDVDAFHGEMLLAALEGTLVEDAPRLLMRLGELRDRTRALFSETYEPMGVEDELAVRYGPHEEYLEGLRT